MPNNLMPYVMQVAVGRRAHLTVHGGDYPTPDGTAIRDYLHVVDLAEGHLAALDHLDRVEGAVAVNLGTGTGWSVLDVVRAASVAVVATCPTRSAPRRHGDVVAVGPTRPGPAAARLAGVAHARRDVRRPLALAGVQPRRLRRQLSADPQASGQPAGMLAATAAQTSRWRTTFVARSVRTRTT